MNKQQEGQGDILKIETKYGYIEILPPKNQNSDYRLKAFHKELGNILFRDKFNNLK